MQDVPNIRASEQRSSDELVRLALAAQELDDDDRWDAIRTLHFRGGQSEFDLAVALTKSAEAKARALGAGILAQLGYTSDKFIFPLESVNILIELLSDVAEEVIWSAAHALGHRKDERSIPHLCGLADHPSEDVRYAVACALGGFENEFALSTLIKLTADADTDVRDWATFGLGTLLNWDTLQIRSALFARASDEDDDTRGEALVGLAVRKDERAFELVKVELQRADVGSLIFEAAEHLADSRLLPYLIKQREGIDEEADSFWLHTLDDAVRACSSSISSISSH
jgi:HEAT repeat protein